MCFLNGTSQVLCRPASRAPVADDRLIHFDRFLAVLLCPEHGFTGFEIRQVKRFRIAGEVSAQDLGIFAATAKDNLCPDIVEDHRPELWRKLRQRLVCQDNAEAKLSALGQNGLKVTCAKMFKFIYVQPDGVSKGLDRVHASEYFPANRGEHDAAHHPSRTVKLISGKRDERDARLGVEVSAKVHGAGMP